MDTLVTIYVGGSGDLVVGWLLILAVGPRRPSFLYMSFWKIGPTEMGLVRKRFGFKKLDGGNIVGFKGRGGYQAELLRSGIRFKPLAHVRGAAAADPADFRRVEIAVVIAQVGAPIAGRRQVGNLQAGIRQLQPDLKGVSWTAAAQKGPCSGLVAVARYGRGDPSGRLSLVVSKASCLRHPGVRRSWCGLAHDGKLTFGSFGLTEKQLEVTKIEPKGPRP